MMDDDQSRKLAEILISPDDNNIGFLDDDRIRADRDSGAPEITPIPEGERMSAREWLASRGLADQGQAKPTLEELMESYASSLRGTGERELQFPIGEDFTGYSVHSNESGWLLPLKDFMADWLRRYPPEVERDHFARQNLEWANCAESHKSRAEAAESREAKLRECLRETKSALDRTLWNFRLLLEQKPVRDAAECIAEAEHANELVESILKP